MQLDFDKADGLVPAVVQHASSKQVLMLGYMNEEALGQTLSSGKVTFFSRSKNRLWTKGETSGNYLLVEEILPDCDRDAVLVKALPQGPTCHLGTTSCFGKEERLPLGFLLKLQAIIADRHQNPADHSYTSSLFSKGAAKISQKVGEEAVEVVIEGTSGNVTALKEESADLLYHLMILWQQHGTSIDDVVEVLEKRH